MKTTENTQLVQGYLDAMFGDHADYERARTFLADELAYEGPMLEAANADEFIGQMRQLGGELQKVKLGLRGVVESGEQVAAFYSLDAVLFGELFRVRDGKIASITIAHDTFPYRGGR